MLYRLTWWVLPLLCLSGNQAIGADEPHGATLPLKRVVLFNSGVGFFERSGQVQDNAKVEMKFKTDDVNDLLKSMVVQDLDGGQASTVTYGSKDPITKTLGSFTIDLTANPSLAQLLGQIRGERVELEAPNKLSGIILGVETHKKKLADRETIDVDVLNLLTDEGLRAVPLDSVSRIKLSNDQLDAELRKALAVLASAHATDKKSVELELFGKRDASRARGIRPRDARLENHLSPGAFRRQAALARLGDRGKHLRRRLVRRQPDAGERPADLVYDGPLRAALHSAAAGATGTLLVAAATNPR